MEKETKNKWLKRAIMSASLFVATSFGFNANAQTAKTPAPKAKAKVTNVQKAKTASAKQRTISAQERLKEQKALKSLMSAWADTLGIQNKDFANELKAPQPISSMEEMFAGRNISYLDNGELNGGNLTAEIDTSFVLKLNDNDRVFFQTAKVGDKTIISHVMAVQTDSQGTVIDRASFNCLGEQVQGENAALTTKDAFKFAENLAGAREVQDLGMEGAVKKTTSYVFYEIMAAKKRSESKPYDPNLDNNLTFVHTLNDGSNFTTQLHSRGSERLQPRIKLHDAQTQNPNVLAHVKTNANTMN